MNFLTQTFYRFTSLRSATFAQSLPYLERAPLQPHHSTVVMMLNLGGPNNQTEITPFLTRFFSDTTVIRIPFGLGPYIAKLRGPTKINKQYNAIGGGSPLLQWTLKQANQILTHPFFKDSPIGILPAFRYGLPLQEDAIEYAFEKTQGNLKQIVLFSQYPQYSCTTGGSSIRNAIKTLEQYRNVSKQEFSVSVIDQWHDHEKYVEALASIISDDIKANNLDPAISRILFSAHSLPAEFVWQGDKYPYYIYETCQLVIKQLKTLGINISFELGFQSKVGLQTWLQPSTENALNSLITKDSTFKNIIISPIGFTSDHLETLYEIDQYLLDKHKIESEKQGKTIIRSRSLNDHPEFIDALASILSEGTQRTPKGRRQLCSNCKVEDCKIVNIHTL